ncbi:MAG: MerR family DNA-binding transcriptional regulator, partial [SAR86 cluster bacterium]
MPQKTHTISELARAFDITTRTIRFYEEKGLL